MFEPCQKRETALVRIVFDGEQLRVPDGISLAAALLTHTDHLRTTHGKQNKRGPYCMMGACFDCLVTVDGRQNQRACMRQVREGMVISRQLLAPLPGNAE